MSEYIERDKAIDGLSKLRPRMIDTYEKDGDPCLKVKAIDVDEMLQQLPSADVQPVVHCPKCEYWDERLIRCNKHKDSMMYGVHDFCSKGKRKGADTEC